MKEFTRVLEMVEEICAEIRQGSPNPEIQERSYYNLGNSLYRAGEQTSEAQQKSQAWEQALKSYENALKLNPKDADAAFNRDVVKQRLEELKKQPSPAVGELFIFVDECHRTQSGKLHKTMKALLPAAVFIGFTGTPIENRALDLWSIMQFVNPGYLGRRGAFAARYDRPDAPRHLRRLLAARLRPVMVRRLKEQVAPDLPDRIEETRECELTPGQRKLYLAELMRGRATVERLKASPDGVMGHKFEVLTALTRLRQVCCHPALVGGRDPEGSEVVAARVAVARSAALDRRDGEWIPGAVPESVVPGVRAPGFELGNEVCQGLAFALELRRLGEPEVAVAPAADVTEHSTDVGRNTAALPVEARDGAALDVFV
jgi:hypothetical protein